jgi:hypothetical protein
VGDGDAVNVGETLTQGGILLQAEHMLEQRPIKVSPRTSLPTLPPARATTVERASLKTSSP